MGSSPPAGGAGLPCQKSSNSTETEDASSGLTVPAVSAHHRKAAAALGWNVAAFVDRHGLDYCGFLTLTPPDQVEDRREWETRFRSLRTHVLGPRYRDWIRVFERQKSGRIHAHLLVALPFDCRTGVDFAAFAENDYRSASGELRDEWSYLRRTLPRYGFGRHELHPVRTTSAAIGTYIGKYIAKHLDARAHEDKGWRLVGYANASRVARTRFSWSESGVKWRRGVERLAVALSETQGYPLPVIRRIGLSAVLGPRWARDWRHLILTLGESE